MNRAAEGKPRSLILTSVAQALTLLGFGLAATVAIGLFTDAANSPALTVSAIVSIPLLATSGAFGLLATINAIRRDFDLARRRGRASTLALTGALITLFIGGIL